MANIRLFIDSDIIIDHLARREHHESATKLLTLVERHVVDGFTTPIVLANVEYVIRKHSTKAKAKQAIQQLIKSLSVLAMNQAIAEKASGSRFSDFEDAMQYYAAAKGKMNYIITRNKKDYASGSLPVMTAEEFIAMHVSSEESAEV